MDHESYPEVLLPIDFDEQIDNLARWAEPQYSEEAEFHPFSHAWGVYETSMYLAGYFEDQHYKVNRRALAFAAIGHDIGENKDLNYQPVPGQVFKTKVARAAWLTRDHLLLSGYDLDSVAQPAYELINITKFGSQIDTIEGTILRMADIFNASQEFEVFEERAQALHREKCHFDQKDCSFEEWLPGAMDYLIGFLDDSMPEWFKHAVLENVEKLKAKYLLSV